MILGTGIDIIEVERVENQISNSKGFKETIFTKREIKYCESKKNKAQHYAARFAAKEAFFKAIGTGWRDGMSFVEIEILNNELGKPEVILHGKTKEFSKKQLINNIHVSLSHIKNLVTAIITLEK
ncbi:MAG: holo-ACP synthase [Bacteroidales bacterium]